MIRDSSHDLCYSVLLVIFDSGYDSNIFENEITQSNTQTHGDTQRLTQFYITYRLSNR